MKNRSCIIDVLNLIHKIKASHPLLKQREAAKQQRS